MKKQIPILISTQLIPSTIEEIKTMTRRLNGLDEINKAPDEWAFSHFEENVKGGINAVFKGADRMREAFGECLSIPSPYGRSGDFLYVRENWQLTGWDFEEGEAHIGYQAGGIETHFWDDLEKKWLEWMLREIGHLERKGIIVMDEGKERFHLTEKKHPFKPNIHLPKWASRIWLEVTDVRVERLHKISGEDVLAEGVGEEYCSAVSNYNCWGATQRIRFSTLWTKINGPESWNSNPWVWVVSFRVLSTTGKPAELGKEGAV